MSRRNVRVVERHPPTPETKAKLRDDVIRTLYARKQLDGEHVAAAGEIRDMWLAFGKGLFPRPQDDGIKIDRSTFTSPIDRLTDAELRIYSTRYKPWADEMGAKTEFGMSKLQLILDAVVENALPKHTSHLKDGLHRYAQIAGWLT